MLLGGKMAFCLAILWKAEITSPLLWVIFFSYSSKPPELFPSHRFLSFISFSFYRRSGLIKGGVRLLTCCVKMTGTQLPKRERGLRPSWLQSPVSGVYQLRFRSIVYRHLSSTLYSSSTWPVRSDKLPFNPYNNTPKAGVTAVLEKKGKQKDESPSRPPNSNVEDQNGNELFCSLSMALTHCSVFPSHRSERKMDKFCRSHTHRL